MGGLGTFLSAYFKLEIIKVIGLGGSGSYDNMAGVAALPIFGIILPFIAISLYSWSQIKRDLCNQIPTKP